MLTAYETRTYRALRKEGRAASHAYFVVKSMRDADAVLTHTSSLSGSPYGRPWAAYDMDLAELQKIAGMGIPDSLTARLYVYQDDTRRDPSEEECYDEEDVLAWRNDEWTFVGISVVITRPDGATGEGALWGIECGDHWPGTDESDLWHAVPDVFHEALGELESTPATPLGQVEQIRNLLPDEDADLTSDVLGDFLALVREIVQ